MSNSNGATRISPMASWHADHANYARLLDSLERESRSLAAGERPNYALMLDILTYLRHYPDRHHHPREDEVFARVSSRLPGAAAQVSNLAHQHRALAEAGQSLLEQIDQAANDGVVSRAGLINAAGRYIAAYREHIAAEEDSIMPRAAAALSPEDWNEVAHAGAPSRDPLFGDAPDERYRELRRTIAHESGGTA